MDKIEKKDKIQITRSGEFSYTICLRRDFSQLAASVAACRPQGGKICIVTDTHVRPLYMEEVKSCPPYRDCTHISSTMALNGGICSWRWAAAWWVI